MRPGQLLFWATSPLSGTRPGALGRGGSEPPICYDLTPPFPQLPLVLPVRAPAQVTGHRPRAAWPTGAEACWAGRGRMPPWPSGLSPLILPLPLPSLPPGLSLPGAPLSTPVKWGGTRLCGVFSGSVHREAGTSCTLTPTDLLGLARLVPWRPLPPYGALSSGPHCACTPMPWTHRAPQSRGLLSWEARAPARSAGTR